MLVDLLVSLLPYAVVAPVLLVAWNVVKRVLSLVDDPLGYSSPVDPDRELRLSQARMRRLRTARYASEHESWSAEFSALTGGCPHCAGARRSAARPASRYVPYL